MKEKAKQSARQQQEIKKDIELLGKEEVTLDNGNKIYIRTFRQLDK